MQCLRPAQLRDGCEAQHDCRGPRRCRSCEKVTRDQALHPRLAPAPPSCSHPLLPPPGASYQAGRPASRAQQKASQTLLPWTRRPRRLNASCAKVRARPLASLALALPLPLAPALLRTRLGAARMQACARIGTYGSGQHCRAQQRLRKLRRRRGAQPARAGPNHPTPFAVLTRAGGAGAGPPPPPPPAPSRARGPPRAELLRNVWRAVVGMVDASEPVNEVAIRDLLDDACWQVGAAWPGPRYLTDAPRGPPRRRACAWAGRRPRRAGGGRPPFAMGARGSGRRAGAEGVAARGLVAAAGPCHGVGAAWALVVGWQAGMPLMAQVRAGACSARADVRRHPPLLFPSPPRDAPPMPAARSPRPRARRRRGRCRRRSWRSTRFGRWTPARASPRARWGSSCGSGRRGRRRRRRRRPRRWGGGGGGGWVVVGGGGGGCLAAAVGRPAGGVGGGGARGRGRAADRRGGPKAARARACIGRCKGSRG